jgi:DNA-binding transcriptional LysR family regulator
VVTAGQPAELVAQLLDGRIHVGLYWDYDFAPRNDQGLQREHLLEDPLLVLLPLDHPAAEPESRSALRLRELAAAPWVVRSHRAPYEAAFESMCSICGFAPDIVFRTEDYQSMQGLVAAGIGLGVVPRLSLAAQRPDVVARPFVEPAFSRRIGALTLPEARRDPMVLQLLDVLARVTGQMNEDRPKGS